MFNVGLVHKCFSSLACTKPSIYHMLFKTYTHFPYVFIYNACFCYNLSICYINILRLRQNGHHFAEDTFKCIFLYENIRISIKISLKFVPKGPINNNPALVQIMAWHRSGDKPLSEAIMVSLMTHLCVTRPQWVITPVLTEHKTSVTFEKMRKVFYRVAMVKNKVMLSSGCELPAPGDYTRFYLAF